MLARRDLILAGTSALLLSAAASVDAAPATRLIRRGDRLWIAARVNGVAVEALLDSAAEGTLVSPAFAARLGLASGEAATGHGSGAKALEVTLVEHVRLEAAGVRVPDATIAVVDLRDVSARLLGRPVDVVLGREIFDAARLRIDIPRLRIETAPPKAEPRGVPLPLTTERGVEHMPVVIEDRAPTTAEFDLGNGSGLLLSRRYAERAGLLDGRRLGREIGGGLGGAKPRATLVVKSLILAGRRFTNVPASLDDAPDAPDANVGVGLLQHFRITTDFAAHVLWLDDTGR